MLRQFITQNGTGYRLPYPAACWEEGILLGNGSMGADLCGTAEEERILLTQEELYAPADVGVTSIPMAGQLEKIRTLLDEGKSGEASDLIVEMFHQKEGLDEKLWTNPFFPAGEIHIFTENCGISHGYERSLTFAEGEGLTIFDTKGNHFERRALVSREDACLVLQLSSVKKASYRIRLSQTPYVKNGMHVNKLLFEASGGEDFFQPEIRMRENSIWYRCSYRERKNGYGIVLCVPKWDGEQKITGEELCLSQGENAVILASVFPVEEVNGDEAWEQEENRLQSLICAAEEAKCREEADSSGKNKQELKSETSSGQELSGPGFYAHLRKRHEELHRERFERLHLELENKHLEAMFHAGRYEILSSEGQTPPNLQGVWCGTYDTPWSSDYTQNGNLETAILGMLPEGDFEGMRSLFDYEERLLPDFQTNSRVLYGCRGIHIPSRTSDSGIDFHFDKTWPMLFWTAGAGWISHFYYDYWLYTCDDDFFRERALPFMKEAALFYEDYLYEDERGYWKFSPSYSPENTPQNRENSACINATMDISVATELFRNLITGCQTLGIEKEQVEKWKQMLIKMPPYLVNKEGALKEWAAPELEDRYDHRHSSHLYMLYYGRAEEESPEIHAAAKKAYEIKMERKKEEQGTMAFGLVQAGMAAAHLGDASMVETMLQSMAQNNYYRTYASSHDYGPSIFNADISGGVPALMLESLIQCYPVCDENGKISSYKIYLLPALPESMKTGKASGIHLRGGMKADLEWKEGRILSWNIENPFQKDYLIVK